MTFRLTYGATLAELTSLEEMTRILMESGQVHVDVIKKLWQVYSKCCVESAGAAGLMSVLAYSNPSRELPKQQRRGAVIILGMLAVASPKIVETRREDLIKIGLGARGKVSPVDITCLELWLRRGR